MPSVGELGVGRKYSANSLGEASGQYPMRSRVATRAVISISRGIPGSNQAAETIGARDAGSQSKDAAAGERQLNSRTFW
jgi:hypothetical protein